MNYLTILKICINVEGVIITIFFNRALGKSVPIVLKISALFIM